MAITATIAQDMLNRYIAAERAVLEGKSIRIGDRQYTSEDLEAIRAGRKEWSATLAALQSGLTGRGPRIYGVTPGG